MISKRVDSVGRIHIPKELRDACGIEINDILSIERKDRKLIIETQNKKCRICSKSLTDIEEKDKICSECLTEIKKNHN